MCLLLDSEMYYFGNSLEAVLVLLICLCLFFVLRRKRDLLGVKVELLVALILLGTGQFYNIIDARLENRGDSKFKQICWSTFAIILTGFSNL